MFYNIFKKGKIIKLFISLINFIDINAMENIFSQLFQYVFHDTDITSIEGEGLEIKLNFKDGIYLLDEKGNVTDLSKPKQIILKLDSCFNSFEDAFEIKELGKKLKYLDYPTFKKYLLEDSLGFFGIRMIYYSSKCILFDGGTLTRYIMLSIKGIKEIIIQDL